MPALSSSAPTARDCSSDVNTGLRTRRVRSALSAIIALEFCEIGCHRIDCIGFERKLEQGRCITACHSGHDHF